MELASCHPFGTQSLELAVRFVCLFFVENLYTPLLRGLCDMNTDVTLVL